MNEKDSKKDEPLERKEEPKEAELNPGGFKSRPVHITPFKKQSRIILIFEIEIQSIQFLVSRNSDTKLDLSQGLNSLKSKHSI